MTALEADYVAHLIRAEEAMKRIYPFMLAHNSREAFLAATECQDELTAFMQWILRNKAK